MRRIDLDQTPQLSNRRLQSIVVVKWVVARFSPDCRDQLFFRGAMMADQMIEQTPEHLLGREINLLTFW